MIINSLLKDKSQKNITDKLLLTEGRVSQIKCELIGRIVKIYQKEQRRLK